MEMDDDAMSRESKMTIRLPYWEHQEAKAMSGLLGLSLDGMVREALEHLYKKNGEIYEAFASRMTERAESLRQKKINAELRR